MVPNTCIWYIRAQKKKNTRSTVCNGLPKKQKPSTIPEKNEIAVFGPHLYHRPQKYRVTFGVATKRL